MRIGLAIVASLTLTLGVAGHAAACITYSRGFALGGSDNVTLHPVSNLLLVAINTGDSEQLSWGVIHGTALMVLVGRADPALPPPIRKCAPKD